MKRFYGMVAGWCVASFFLLSLAGCISTAGQSASTVAPGSPVGWVQFYNGPKAGAPFARRVAAGTLGLGDYYSVARVREGSRKVGDVLRANNNSEQPAFLQVAASPGAHTYVLEAGEQLHAVTVTVEEGRIIPVRIEIIETGREQAEWGRVQLTFDFQTEIRSAMDFDPASATAGLLAALESQDWETRWIAVVLLEELKDPGSRDALSRLADNDPDATVTSYAQRALRGIR